MNHFNTWFCSRGSHIFVTKKFISAGYKTRSLNITMQPQCSSYLDHLAVNKQRVYVSLSVLCIYSIHYYTPILVHRVYVSYTIYIYMGDSTNGGTSKCHGSMESLENHGGGFRGTPGYPGVPRNPDCPR